MSETKPGMPSLTVEKILELLHRDLNAHAEELEKEVRKLIKEEIANFNESQREVQRQLLEVSARELGFTIVRSDKQRDPSESQATEAESDRVYQTHYHSMD